MNFKKVKIEIYIPAEYTPKLREALNNIGALGVGNYDNVMTVTKITGYWRPLEGANPFDGKVNEISEAPEDMVGFSTDAKNIPNIINVIKEVHPYEEPVINIIPLLNDKFDVNLDYWKYIFYNINKIIFWKLLNIYNIFNCISKI